ncbi:hypothetical protein GCM10008101_06770 [Lysobacter xinjiangensis]|uniref:Uncharacterized protein n=1 Tax=Cognatilysobacter xinjiangensis TaxID=546892 RepID=A0ABQ3BVF4_9GAMM|nr:hypothetical protein [Lysobacter xinjiangensis]GGZ56012.1 hypothetical protein GCM10008101_06770 [Lysobacter xinjiangensis]
MSAQILRFPARQQPDVERQRKLALEAREDRLLRRLEEMIAAVMRGEHQDTESDDVDARLARAIANAIERAPRKQ